MACGFYSNVIVSAQSGCSYRYNIYADFYTTSYFNALTEHAGGIKVSGENDDANFYFNGTALTLRAGPKAAGVSALQIGVEGEATQYIASCSIPTHSTKRDIVGYQHSVTPNQYTEGEDQLVRCFNCNIPSTHDHSQYKAIHGFSVKINQETVAAEQNYGYYSNMSNNNGGAKVRQFYLEGNAPSFSAGDIYIHRVSGGGGLIDGNEANGGVHLTRLGLTRSYSSQGGSNANPAVLAKRTDPSSQGGWIAIQTSNHDGTASNRINCNGSSFRTIDTRLGATGVAMPDGAADIIKALQPKVITQGGEAFAGFLPTDLAGTYAEAMEGEAGATVAVGTYTDLEGVVQTEVEEPEAIPFGATWVQTGTQDVMQSVCRENLIPLLTKALQEVIAKNEDLEARLVALEGA